MEFIEDENFAEKDYFASIFLHHDLALPRHLAINRHTYVLHASNEHCKSLELTHSQVSFSGSRLTPLPFRKRTIANTLNSPFRPVDMYFGLEPISFIDDACVWAIGNSNKYYHYEVGMMLPAIPPKEPLFKWFNGKSFIETLPLIDFIRNITGISDYSRLTQTACIVFDDPNLHFKRYGFIKYGELAQHARQNNYHVAFATIPLDLYYANKAAIELFRNASEHLSLLIHGNNHRANELGYDYDENKRISIISQALNRTKTFEKHYGVSVSRVMAAPHGVCTELMFKDMARCGIESACVSFGSLYKANREREWTRHMGLALSTEILGLPIFNRFPLSADHINEIFLAAYLGQHIIPNGHSWDLKENLDIMNLVAEVVNSLADVQWGSMEFISRSSYLVRTDSETLHIKMMSSQIKIAVPPGVRFVHLEGAGCMDYQRPSNASYSINGQAIQKMDAACVVSVEPYDKICITCPIRDPIDIAQVSLPCTPVGALMRRFATEARDQLRPYGHHLRSLLG